MKVLLLEDTHFFANAIQESLQLIGHEVIWKETPEEALEEMKSEYPPDLCLFDIRIEGWKLTGLDVVEKLKRELGKPVPVIVYTSYDTSNYAFQARAAGIPLKFLVDRNRLDHLPFIEDLIEEAASYYGPPVTDPNAHLYNQFRKIGVCVNSKDAREYLFLAKDEIMFITSEEKFTKMYVYVKAKGKFENRETRTILITTNIGNVGKQIQKTFTNFVKVTQSYWINLEQVSSMEGENLFFVSGDFINIGKEGRSRLRQLNVMVVAD